MASIFNSDLFLGNIKKNFKDNFLVYLVYYLYLGRTMSIELLWRTWLYIQQYFSLVSRFLNHLLTPAFAGIASYNQLFFDGYLLIFYVYCFFCLLFTAFFFCFVFCLLFPVSCFLFPVSCFMFPVSCFLFPVYCLLFTVYCLLFTVYCLLFTANTVRIIKLWNRKKTFRHKL